MAKEFYGNEMELYYEEPQAKEGVLIEGKVGKVIDGDTIYIEEKTDILDDEYALDEPDSYKGLHSIRFANIRTDEVSKDFTDEGDIEISTKAGNPKGVPAAEMVKYLVAGQDVLIDIRISEKTNEPITGAFARHLGVIYTKTNSGWINLNRSLLRTGLAEVLYEENSNLDTNEINAYKKDAEFQSRKETKELAEEIAELDIDNRDEYLGEFDYNNNLRIGDMQLRIPPENIDVKTVNDANPATILRNKTTLKGSTGHNTNQIEMKLYFNGQEDINGYKIDPSAIEDFSYQVKTREDNYKEVSADDINYYVNGLRSLLAQFHLTPFLPVDNKLLNEEHSIYAVTLQNIMVNNLNSFSAANSFSNRPNMSQNIKRNSMTSFPGVLEVKLTLLEFNYEPYVDYSGPFSDLFDWSAFRFYYQRLLNGTNMKFKTNTKLPNLDDIDSFDSNNFSFSLTSAEALNQKQQAINKLQHFPAPGKEDILDGTSKYEKIKHDIKLMEIAKDQRDLFFNNYYNEGEDILTDKYYDNAPYYDDYYEESLYKPQIAWHPVSDNEDIKEIGFFRIPVRSEKVIKILDNYVSDYKRLGGAWDRFLNEIYKVFGSDGYKDYENEDPSWVSVPSDVFDQVYDKVNTLATKLEEQRQKSEQAQKVGNELNRDTWTMPNANLQNIAVSMSNQVNEIKPNMQNNPTHQYLGSQQVIISLKFVTGSDEQVRQFRSMVNYLKSMQKRYHDIINLPLMDFHNDIVTMFGLDGVGFEEMDINTIPGVPGTYEIKMTLVGYSKSDDEIGLNALGSTNISKRSEANKLDYFNLKDKMKYINLYPDLDLPRYSELPQNYELYNAGDERFVDPDFYLVNTNNTVVDKVEEVLATNQEYETTNRDGKKSKIKVNADGDIKLEEETAEKTDQESTYKPPAERKFEEKQVFKPEQINLINLIIDLNDSVEDTTINMYKDTDKVHEWKKDRLIEIIDNSNYVIGNIKEKLPVEAQNMFKSYLLDNWYYQEDKVSNERIYSNKIQRRNSNEIYLKQKNGQLTNKDNANYIGILQLNINKFDYYNPDKAAKNYITNLKALVHIVTKEYNKLVDQVGTINLEPDLTNNEDNNSTNNEVSTRKGEYKIGRSKYVTELDELDRMKKEVKLSLWAAAFMKVAGVSIEDFTDNQEDAVDEYNNFISKVNDKLDYNFSLPLLRSRLNQLIDTSQEDNLNKVAEERDIQSKSKDELFKGSFHDMKKYDKRGRLVRAFPSYYLVLIDEGKEAWWWKLDDTFYDYNGVESIDVVRSRKNVADSCMITINDSQKDLSTADDAYRNARPDMSVSEVLWSLTPMGKFEQMKEKASKEPSKVKLEAGARVHLRMGYGSSPDKLPTLFNGTITELKQEKEKVVFVGQSDGIELTNPLPAKREDTTSNFLLKDIMGLDVDNLYTDQPVFLDPRDVIVEILQDPGENIEEALTGGIMSNIFKDVKHSILGIRSHPLGINHFGWLEVPDLWKNSPRLKEKYLNDEEYQYNENVLYGEQLGEICQNINTALINGEDTETLAFSMYLYNKTTWDVLQSCALGTPNYIATVHPFGFRSTIFFGHPNHEFAYDYDKVDQSADASNANITEKTKPYRQLHVYNSFDTIIDNQVKATQKGLKTVVKPVAQETGKEGKIDDFSKIYLDSDIYPELQKMVNVDTGLEVDGALHTTLANLAKAVVGQGEFNPNFDFWTEEDILSIVNTSTVESAQRVGKSTLQNYVKNMYQGNLIITGDPTIKPYDYFYMADMVNGMDGMAEVEKVVHTMNKQVGFVTSITPDPVTVINEGSQMDSEFMLWASSKTKELYLARILPKMLATKFLPGLFDSYPVLMQSIMSKVARGSKNAVKGLFEGISNKKSNTWNMLQEIASENDGKKLQATLDRLEDSKAWLRKSYKKALDKGGDIAGEIATGAERKQVLQMLQGRYGINVDDLNNIQLDNLAKQFGYKFSGSVNNLIRLADNAEDTVDAVTSLIGAFNPIIKIGWEVTQFIAVESIAQFIDDKRELNQALTIMLLSKNGSEFSAGIDGHQGVAISDDPSSWDKFWDHPVLNFFLGKNETVRYRDKITNQFKSNEALFMDELKEGKVTDNPINDQIDADQYDTEIKKLNDIMPEERSKLNEEDLDKPTKESKKIRTQWITKASSIDFALTNYKGVKVHPHLKSLLKELEQNVINKYHVLDELELSDKDVGNGTSKLYNNGLAVRVITDYEDVNNESLTKEVAKKSTQFGSGGITDFENCGVAIGDGYVHLDLAPYGRWQIGDNQLYLNNIQLLEDEIKFGN